MLVMFLKSNYIDNNTQSDHQHACRFNIPHQTYEICDISKCNTVAFKLSQKQVADNDICRFPSQIMYAEDILGLTNNLPNSHCNCILEISSFKIVELYSNHRCSIRGYYWDRIPTKFLNRYSFYRERRCIEVNGFLILISPYNNLFDEIGNGDLVEIIPQNNFNLLSISI